MLQWKPVNWLTISNLSLFVLNHLSYYDAYQYIYLVVQVDYINIKPLNEIYKL